MQVSEMGDGFVFEDKDEDVAVWEHEHRLAALPPPGECGQLLLGKSEH